MALSNRDRVGRALELLNRALRPYVEREMQGIYKHRWEERARDNLREENVLDSKCGEINWDTHALLVVMWNEWKNVFGRTLGYAERSLVSELRDTRNRWAHQKPFSLDDTYRAYDSIHRLLQAISAPNEAVVIGEAKQELLRQRFEEQASKESRKATAAPTEGKPASGLLAWRDIIIPHPDVASGRYQQAEFMADLSQVHRGEGADEYRDPRAFFDRTYLTIGLRRLLSGAVERITSPTPTGDPVIELQTNFGGGKTHSMLALYHLFSGADVAAMPGIEGILSDLNVSSLPAVQRAVLVGQALSPGQPHTKPDGTIIHTLWGELAYQLLGRDGYAMVAQADRTGTNPGSDVLRLLFQTAAPCLILIDEWVAYVRQVYTRSDLPGGSFDANLTFAQSLTEAARAVPHTLVVASLPSSDIEIGGEGGREALNRLRNTFGRVESAWRPASAEEGFEIVRRRLFQPITAPSLFVARDAVVKAFANLYQTYANDVPSFCRESDYERRMQSAYPIHPELFDRLYTDWAAIDRFQRTRGVLRLMAAVIHCLWERQDRSLMILPAHVPIDDPAVQFELTRYMDDHWVPVIEKDVDGPHSLPMRMDRDNPSLGRFSAARRVARTLYLGSAPTIRTANQGLEDRQIKLGCVQPGENPSLFGDVLRRLADQATHLYQNAQRFWFSTQPSVNRLAKDRAEQLTDDDLYDELNRRLQEVMKQRGRFMAVHLEPRNSSDVPDEPTTRLVVLSPLHMHTAFETNSPAIQYAKEILEWRGTIPRHYRNTLIFLAAERTRMVSDLLDGVRQYLAWTSIYEEREVLNLDVFQMRQTETRREQAEKAITTRIPETYYWLLVPIQDSPQAPVRWEEIKSADATEDHIIVRASRRICNQELMIVEMSGTRLRMELDEIPLWPDDHVSIATLVEYFTRYLYLPRIQTAKTIVSAVEHGVASTNWENETFAYATSYDEETGRYEGLVAGQVIRINLEAGGLVVKPAAARRQFDREKPSVLDPHPHPDPDPGRTGTGTSKDTIERPKPKIQKWKRFHGSVDLNPTTMSSDAGKIAESVVQHLKSIYGAKVRVTLEIAAEMPEGFSDHTVMTVTENSRTLKFTSAGFEEE